MTYRFLAVLLTTGTMFAQVDVLTRRVDNLRSGVNSHETTLTQDAVHRHEEQNQSETAHAARQMTKTPLRFFLTASSISAAFRVMR